MWDHADNTELRELRDDPNVLQEGDLVVVPDRRPASFRGATGLRHRFQVRLAKPTVSLRLLGVDEQRPGVEYLLEVDGVTTTGRTDADGHLEFEVGATTSRAQLVVDEHERYDLELGHLDPVTEPSGQRQRLINLGYLHPESSDPDEVDIAVLMFKQDHCGLEIEAAELAVLDDQRYLALVEIDRAAAARLLEVHGS